MSSPYRFLFQCENDIDNTELNFDICIALNKFDGFKAHSSHLKMQKMKKIFSKIFNTVNDTRLKKGEL